VVEVADGDDAQINDVLGGLDSIYKGVVEHRIRDALAQCH
jgi:hypothetical protein